MKSQPDNGHSVIVVLLQSNPLLTRVTSECPAGHYLYKELRNLRCRECPGGHYRGSGEEKCAKCPEGTTVGAGNGTGLGACQGIYHPEDMLMN